MKKVKREGGFTLVEALIIVLVLAVVGFAGWWVWQKNQDKDKKADSTSQNSNNSSKTEESDDQGDRPVTKLTLLDGQVTFDVPDNWKETTPPYPCQSPTDKTSCVGEGMVVPVEGPKTQGNELFGAQVWIYTAGGAPTAKDWFLQKYEGGQAVAADQTSTDAVNSYSTYYFKQNTESYSDIWYVFLKGERVVVVYSRVSEKHYTPSGQVDQSSDYTKYSDAVAELAKSITIK